MKDYLFSRNYELLYVGVTQLEVTGLSGTVSSIL